MRYSCSGVHRSNTGSRISNGTPPTSAMAERTEMTDNGHNFSLAQGFIFGPLLFTICEYAPPYTYYTYTQNSPLLELCLLKSYLQLAWLEFKRGCLQIL